MTKGLKINVEFEKLTNTDFWEQYMVNAFQFSAAKCEVERRLIQQGVYDENHVKRSFSQFRNNIDQDLEVIHDSWWRTEYDLAVNGSIQAEKWRNDIWKNRDINPYATFRASMQLSGSLTCGYCEDLNGISFRVDSYEASKMFVPVHFNCGCVWETSNDDTIKLSDEEDLRKLVDDNVPPMFQKNVGTEGVMPSKNHSYFELEEDRLFNINKLSYENFGSEYQKGQQPLNLATYSDNQIQLAIKDWSEKAPKGSDDLIFRNHEWKLNYRLPHETMERIHNNRKGFENLKETIEHPSEIWARWEDPDKQKKVLMNFIKFDKHNAYVVETKAGYIMNAYLLFHKDSIADRRKGIKFIK
jgi:hypothetical protein